MPHVVVIGSYPSEFLTHLQAAGYTHTEHSTYSEVCGLYHDPSLLTNRNPPLPAYSQLGGTPCGRGCSW
jgi:hypothetical protein